MQTVECVDKRSYLGHTEGTKDDGEEKNAQVKTLVTQIVKYHNTIKIIQVVYIRRAKHLQR